MLFNTVIIYIGLNGIQNDVTQFFNHFILNLSKVIFQVFKKITNTTYVEETSISISIYIYLSIMFNIFNLRTY